MKSESKSWQRFEGKLRSLKQYLQLMDLALTLSNKRCNKKKNEGISVGVALGGKSDSHRQLNNPNLPKEIRRTFVAARKQLNEQAFVELHCLYSDYISHIVSEMSHGTPTRLLDILGKESDRTIGFAEIIKLGSYDAIIDEMARRIFRILENLRSSTQLMQRLCKIANITIEEELLEKSLIYIDVRHLIIHNDSVADEKFIERDKDNLIPLSRKKLSLNYDTTNRASNTIYELCRKIDAELIKNGLVPIRPQ